MFFTSSHIFFWEDAEPVHPPVTLLCLCRQFITLHCNVCEFNSFLSRKSIAYTFFVDSSLEVRVSLRQRKLDLWLSYCSWRI